MMEVLVFVDGVDAMTSKVMQARRNYMPSEMMLNEQVGGYEGWGQQCQCKQQGPQQKQQGPQLQPTKSSRAVP